MPGRHLYQGHLAAARTLGTHTPEEWQAMKRVYKSRCVRCKRLALGTLTRDHVVPVSLGGSDCITNLQPLCPECNRRKGSKIIDYRIGKPETPLEYLQPWAAGLAMPRKMKAEEVAIEPVASEHMGQRRDVS